MKIEQISCKQFAGIRDREYAFDGGINVLLGKNETGKSTIIDLIYNLLYHDVDAKQSEKEEKDFRSRYYPKGIGIKGDNIDGCISIQADDGEYVLSKCWGEGAYSQLTIPGEITIKSQDTINEFVGNLLRYRRGLYDDIVFAPQRKQEAMVAHIFQAVNGNKKQTDKDAAKVKTDLITIIAQEAIRNAGVDANAFEKQLAQIIDSFEGCWDASKDAPKANSLRTKRNGDKPKNEGRLFKAYYLTEHLRQLHKNAYTAEKAVDRDAKEIQALEKKLQCAIEKQKEFEKYAPILSAYAANIALIASLKGDISRRKQAAKDYPGLKKTYAKAHKLSIEFREAEALELFTTIAEKRSDWEKAKCCLDGMIPIHKEDLDKIEEMEKTLQYVKKEQFGIDILAQLRNTGFRDIEVRSLSDNRIIMKLEPNQPTKNFDVIEPVEIVVPGYMRLKLTNHISGFYGRRMNTESLVTELVNQYKKLGITSCSFEELYTKKEEYDHFSRKVQYVELIYKTALGNRDWHQLDETYRTLSKRKKRRPIAEIKEDIRKLCGEKSIDVFCGELYASIKGIEDTYKDELGEITRESLRESAAQYEEKLNEAAAAVSMAESIPQQYKRIKDISQHRATLSGEIDAINTKISEVNGRLQENQNNLGKKSAEEYYNDLEVAEEEYRKVHDLYKHWTHIRDVFRETRKNTGDASEMRDIENRFSEYLRLISNGRIILNSLSDTLDVNITSKNSQLDEYILSEGTKETIALAFRLATLEHIFPNGGAILVLDDPFTEMDEERTFQACNLVKEFSEKGNQVIYTTCRKETAKQLGGKLIHFK